MSDEQQIRDDVTEIKDKLDSLHDKLFVGNGQPPITVQIDRLNSFKTFSCWVMAILTIASVGLLGDIIHSFITTK